MWKVTSRRRGSTSPQESARNSGTIPATVASRSRRPRSYKIMAIVVVATTLVTEARSKTVAGFARRELGSKSNVPKDFSTRNRLRYATARHAAGKARCRTASRNRENGVEKAWSCSFNAGARVQTLFKALCKDELRPDGL